MAKRRTVKRRKTRTLFKKKATRRKSKSMGGDLLKVGGGLAYGAGRQWVSDKLAPVSERVAGVAGQYADELVMGGLGYLMMKGKIPFLNKFGITRKIGEAAVYIESARVGAGLASGMMPISNSTTGTSSRLIATVN